MVEENDNNGMSVKHLIPPSEKDLHTESPLCKCHPIEINGRYVHGGLKEFVVNIFDMSSLSLIKQEWN